MDKLRQFTKKKQRKQTVAHAVWSGVVVAAILLINTVWVSNSDRNSTDQAVKRVSEFYLEELAGRRALVISEELKNYVTYMGNALDILEESDLESQESLRSFLGKARQLIGVENFALIDENGLIYTQHNTSSGLVEYDFLSGELEEPVISTLNLYGEKKQAVVAVPVENISFQGAELKACFIQINISDMLSSLTLQTGDNETFCNLYYRNGESLTNDAFGYLSAGKTFFRRSLRRIWKKDTIMKNWQTILRKGGRGRYLFSMRESVKISVISRLKELIGC